MNPYKILVKFASRSRPEKFFAGLDNILSKIDDKVNYVILVSADVDDTSMYNKAVLTRLKHYVDNYNVIPVFGTSTSKIDAINRDMNVVTDWEILINFSDDMEFQVQGFDNIIREKFRAIFPDTNGNIFFNDGFVGDVLSTMTIMGRMFYDAIGYIYHPSYFSLFPDEEYTAVCRKLNKIEYYPDVLYKHNHPANGIGVPDAQLTRTEGYWDVDKKNFQERQLRNYDLKYDTITNVWFI